MKLQLENPKFVNCISVRRFHVLPLAGLFCNKKTTCKILRDLVWAIQNLDPTSGWLGPVIPLLNVSPPWMSEPTFWVSQWHSGTQTENRKVTKSSRDIAHSEILDDLGRSLHRIPMAQRVPYSFRWKPLCLESLCLESRWRSEYYIEFSCQTFFWQSQLAQRVPSSFWKPLYLQCFLATVYPPQRPNTATESRFSERTCSQPANTLHPNAKVLATCPLDWCFPVEGRRYNLKPGRTLQQSTSKWNASDPKCSQSAKTKKCTAHNYMNCCQNMKTPSKYCGHTS